MRSLRAALQFYWKDIARGKEIMLYGTADTTEQLIREVDGTLIVRVKYKDDPKPVDLVEETFEVGSQNMSSQFSVVSLLSRLVA